MTDYDPHTLRTYLLGEAPEELQDELERKILAGGDTYAAMLEAETDLIDDYVRGHLDTAERKTFEEQVLPRFGIAARLGAARRIQAWAGAGESGAAVAEGVGVQAEEGRQEAKPAAPGNRGADPRRAGGRDGWLGGWLGGLLASPALRPVLAAALVLLVGSLGLLAWQTVELAHRVAELSAAHDDVRQEREALSQRGAELAADLAAARATLADADASREDLADARQRIQELEGELAATELRGRRRPPEPRRARVDVTYLLSLATRSAGVQTVEVPEGEGRVVLQLDAGGEGDYYDAFQARLLGPGGDELWSRTGLPVDPDTGTVDLALPARALDPGRHEVLLEGLAGGEAELVGAYEVDVRRP